MSLVRNEPLDHRALPCGCRAILYCDAADPQHRPGSADGQGASPQIPRDSAAARQQRQRSPGGARGLAAVQRAQPRLSRCGDRSARLGLPGRGAGLGQVRPSQSARAGRPAGGRSSRLGEAHGGYALVPGAAARAGAARGARGGDLRRLERVHLPCTHPGRDAQLRRLRRRARAPVQGRSHGRRLRRRG